MLKAIGQDLRHDDKATKELPPELSSLVSKLDKADEDLKQQ